jgi:SNF2 family DNA or RNA helicase
VSLRAASYQLVPLTKLLLNRQRAILICDGVGVGKTISAGHALNYLLWAEGQHSGLVICPPSLHEKWRSELQEKFNVPVIPIRSTEELEALSDEWNEPSLGRRAYVMSSSLLSLRSCPAFRGPVILDEIHNYRNADTKGWFGARAIVEKASHCIGLSATPVNNRMEDLAAELALILRADRFALEAIVNDLWRPHRRELLYPLLTRFAKDRLGIHFAKRSIRDVVVSWPESYHREVTTVVKSARGRVVSESIRRDEFTYFRLAASSPRAFDKSLGLGCSYPSGKQDALRQILGEHKDERLIIFCEFEETVVDLVESLYGTRKLFKMTGRTPVEERSMIVDAHRRAPNGVLIMTAVGSEGLDLQFCSIVVNFDLTWNPMVLEQRIGRVDRIGQSKDEILVYNFIVTGSIDERIIRTLGKKLGMLSGSVLEPASVLGNDSSVERTPLFLEQDLQSEAREAAAVGQALALVGQIIPEDYSILDAVDERWCNPSKLRDEGGYGGRPVWLRNTKECDQWVRQLESCAGQLQDVLSRFAA